MPHPANVLGDREKTGGSASGFAIVDNTRDYATSSYCGTGLRKLLVTHAR